MVQKLLINYKKTTVCRLAALCLQ